MKRFVLVCTSLLAVAALTACDPPPDPATEETTTTSAGSGTASPTEEATSFPGTATRQELFVASLEVPDGVPFEDATASFQPTVLDRTWTVGTSDDELQCAVILSVWFSTTGWTNHPEEGYTGDGVDEGVTVVSQGPDPAALPGTTSPYAAVETGPSGTVTPAFLGDTTHVFRTFTTPDGLTHVDVDVTALDDYEGCDPAAIASTLQWTGEQPTQATFDAAIAALATS